MSGEEMSQSRKVEMESASFGACSPGDDVSRDVGAGLADTFGGPSQWNGWSSTSESTPASCHHARRLEMPCGVNEVAITVIGGIERC